MDGGPVGTLVRSAPSKLRSATRGGSSFQSSQSIRTRKGTRLSASNATSRIGNAREKTRHLRNATTSPSTYFVCSSKRAAAAALFIAAAALARTEVDRNGTAHAVRSVALFGTDLSPVNAGNPALRVDDMKRMRGLL